MPGNVGCRRTPMPMPGPMPRPNPTLGPRHERRHGHGHGRGHGRVPRPEIARPGLAWKQETYLHHIYIYIYYIMYIYR